MEKTFRFYIDDMKNEFYGYRLAITVNLSKSEKVSRSFINPNEEVVPFADILSISGKYYFKKSRRPEGFGQVYNTPLFVAAYDYFGDDFKFLIDVWKRYHLNDVKAGTKKQEEALSKAEAEGKLDMNLDSYNRSCKYLESIGLLDDNGYKFGTDWLFEEIPSGIIEKLKTILD